MDDIHNLYQEVIIEHSHHPRNFRANPKANHVGEGYNPLCGDRIVLYISEKDGVITDISFQSEGCAIFTASASIMTEVVKGKTIDEIKPLYQAFHLLVTSGDTQNLPEDMEKLKVFSTVAEFPIRVKCATLPWHTLKTALFPESKIKKITPVSTE